MAPQTIPSDTASSSKSDTIHRRRRRPVPVLTLHHLTLYSSSSPHNLLEKTHTSPEASSTTAYGHTTASWSKPTTPPAAAQPAYASNRPHRTEMPPPPHQASPRFTTVDPLHPGSAHFSKPSYQYRDPLRPSDAHVTPSGPSSPSFTAAPPSRRAYKPTTSSSTTASPPPAPDARFDGLVSQLVDMGFDADRAKIALMTCADHTLQGALDLLVSSKPSPPLKPSPPSVFTPPRASSSSSSPESSDDNIDDDSAWEHQQELRRREYIANLKKKHQPAPPKPAPNASYFAPPPPTQPKTTKPTPSPPKASNDTNHGHKPTTRPPFATSTSTASSASSPPQPAPSTSSSRSGFLFNMFGGKFTPGAAPSGGGSHTSSHSGGTSSNGSSAHATPSPAASFQSANTQTVETASSSNMQKASNLRNRGNDLFKLGYYREAEVSYTQALAMLPARHHLTALISNNRAAARLKTHQHRQCVLDCTTTIDWAREQLDLPGNNGGALSLLVDGELINIKWHDQLVKALTRKADALEQMGRQAEAAAAYQELITADPANTRAKDGLARCRNVNKPTPPPPTSSFFPKQPSAAAPAASSAKGATTASTAFPGLDYSIFEKPPVEEEEPKSEAVRAMRERQKKKAEEDRERLLKQDVVNTRIDAWKRGKEKNIRALLTTLDTLMWPGANWRGVTTAELLEPKKVKVTYMRAIAKVHPDKLSADASVEQQLLATSIFAVLNQAWDTFRSNNVM